MSQWKQIQQLEYRLLEHVDYLYDDNFPMDIRQCLASWIESQDWDTAANDDSMATVMFANLLSQLDRVRSQEQNFLQRHNMKMIQQQLQVKYATSPAAMARVISCCLREERRILSSACMQEQGPLEKSLQNSVASERQKSMDGRVGILRGSVQVLDQAVKYIEDLQEDFDFRYKTLQSRDLMDRNSEVMKHEVIRLQEMLNSLDFKRKEVLSKMDVVIKEIDDLMTSQLNPELQDWKRRQQIAAIGGPLLTSLDQLQSWFTLTAQSLFQMKRQLDKLGELVVKVTYECDPIPLQKPQMEERVKYLLYHLIKSSFVVEKQPCMPTHPQKPLIIKTGVQFTTKVRLLVKLPEVDYQLKVKTTFDKDLPPGRVSRQFFILTNNTKVMDIEDYSNGCLSVEFRHLQLKEKKYINGTKGNEGLLSVTEELHSLSFEACFTVQGLTIDLETCSLPLVVISNVSQLPGGWASVMWYNLLTDEPRNLAFFGNPPRATWSQLSEVLSWQFSSLAGQGLNKEQLSMLGEKLLGQHASCSDFQVSWSKFSKENIPGKPFSFWMWLDSILELIKKHLLPVWNESYIMGFVSKEMERALLKDRQPGTFLLRFSESHLGGITFTWVERKDNGEVKFNSVEPYTKSRLNALPFADIIRDYKVISDGVVPENPLKFLFPDIPKDDAFGRLYNSAPNKVQPYIPSMLIPISVRSNGSISPPTCQSPEPPMTPGEFNMLSQDLCLDLDSVSVLTASYEPTPTRAVFRLKFGFDRLHNALPRAGTSRHWEPDTLHLIIHSPLYIVTHQDSHQLQMSQWLQVLQLDWGLQSQVSSLYEGRFPREIRHCLHDVIESKDWVSAAQDESQASLCFQVLLVYLEEQWKRSVEESKLLQRPDFLGMRDCLLRHLQDGPCNLALTLSECLAEEKKVLESASKPQACQRPAAEQPLNVMDNKVNDLTSHTSTIKEKTRPLEDLCEKLNYSACKGEIKKFQEYTNSFTGTTQALLQQIENTLNLAGNLVAELTDVELPQWKARQRLACIGCPVNWSVAHLEKWFTAVAESLKSVQETLQKLQDQNRKIDKKDSLGFTGRLVEMEKFTLLLWTKLISKALVVEKQPTTSSLLQRPQILKTKVKFSVSVRFLVNLPQHFKFLLKVKPSFDKDVQEATTVKGFRRFELGGDNSKMLEDRTQGGGLVAEFSHMILKETKGRVKGSSENGRIVEELHIIKFECDLQHNGVGYTIETSTLPLVVVSSSSQVAEAWASIMWSNVASESEAQNLSFFETPPALTWTQLSEVLSWQFLSVGERGLNESQLAELKEKFVDDPADFVQWSKFSLKDSAWFWIDGILDLIKKYLLDLWRDGLVMGFVSKKKTRALLKRHQSGNFLLRFSESIKEGAITFSWVEHTDGSANIISVEPFTKEDLEKQCLPDSLHHFSQWNQSSVSKNPLLYLYPDIPKDEAFGRYYNSSELQASKMTGTDYLKRYNLSFCVTPPPSPPRASPVDEMLMDIGLDLEPNQLFRDLMSDLWESSWPLNLCDDSSFATLNQEEKLMSEENSNLCGT
ncbi:signal transducer and activator of transcription 4 [Nelusetta ayraudi]|uniref:signal transducer and activator of transcription 4 n=1 Tax=Nelusetta ayraudi TaxID=303726 RepID=UPI003F6EB0DD